MQGSIFAFCSRYLCPASSVVDLQTRFPPYNDCQKPSGTLKFLDLLDTQLSLQTTLESIRDSLNNLVGAPAQPKFQTALASALGSFATASAKLGQAIIPSQSAVIAEMGGEEFFDSSIADKVQALQQNHLTTNWLRFFESLQSTAMCACIQTRVLARPSVKLEEHLRLSPGSHCLPS